ncbi:RNA polymerase-binding protein DksA [Paenalcaligenes faecalis]|uniref:RNA polymerase-binding protein DksA n=1 Tax=Paenalcaligenes faecalis TaxID=2980099 RepID=UPI0022B9B238|nr:RNA polymerase-binding protein DksA [Paenalcaligenes faecalis]
MASNSNVSTNPDQLLTVDELLAMPEDQYMNAAQLAFFQNRLRELEQEILANAGATTENLRETQFVPDPADRATIEEEHALELRTRDRERKLLKKVQQSLGLIDSGEYGWCEETGEPIGLKRLLARPTANLSLEAQERREKRQKLYGD